MNQEILVTIVVPVYNVEKYLEKCIESLQEQTYKNIEIILVNDGSNDNSLEIAKRKAITDNRIKIISQKNQGLSGARNTGINNATGKYICFVDSDDFVHKDYVKLLLENLLQKNADISVCDFWYIDDNNKTWSGMKKKHQVLYSNVEAIKDILVGNQMTEIMTWNKLYKLSLFKEHNIRFPVGKLHEDNFTTYKLYYYSNKISLIPDKLYYYLQRSNSIMGEKFNIKRLDKLQAIEETKEFFKDKSWDLQCELENYEIEGKISILNTMIRDKFNGIEKDKIINDIVKKKKIYKKNKYLTRKIRFALLTIRGKGGNYAFFLYIFDKLKNRRGKIMEG